MAEGSVCDTNAAAARTTSDEQSDDTRRLLVDLMPQLPTPSEMRALDHASYALLELVQRKRMRDPEDAMDDCECAAIIRRVLRKLRRLENLMQGAMDGECPICFKSYAEQARDTPARHHTSTPCCQRAMCCGCLAQLGCRTCPFCRAEWSHIVDCSVCLFGSSTFD